MQTGIKRLLAVLSAVVVLFGFCVQTPAFAADGKTGAGMAEWALRAYNEGWKYVYGGSAVGSIDCSGLIRSYIKGGGGAKALLDAASIKGNVSARMPNIHGLGLWCEGHAGVYVGKNDSGTDMAVDARNSRVNVVYSAMNSRKNTPWVKWFKIKGVTYPTTGWETFNGKTFYYNNGEFVTGIFTVDGKTYNFGNSGALIGEYDPSTATTAPTAKPTTKPTTAATTTASASLRQGSSGAEVTALQKRLKELGYFTGSPTGYYGENTVAAVTLFQRTAGLTADGIAGKVTQQRLYDSSAPKYTPTTVTAAPTTKKTTTAAATTTTAAPTTTATAAKTTPAQTTATTTAAPVTSTAESVSQQTTTAPTTTTAPPPLYETLDIGSRGEAVTALQERLRELGYFCQEVTGYYGFFTRDAIKAFQAKTIPLPTGIADVTTQELLFADTAPLSTDEVDLDLIYGDNLDLEEDGGELEETEPVPEILTIAESEGIASLSNQADVSGFIKKFGGSGALQTMGVLSYSAPTVTIYRNGESFEISAELSRSIDDCVFF